MLESLFNKVATTQVFSCEFAKFLRTPFLQNTSGRLLLYSYASREVMSDPSYDIEILSEPFQKDCFKDIIGVLLNLLDTFISITRDTKSN